jgi:hypothetical protein
MKNTVCLLIAVLGLFFVGCDSEDPATPKCYAGKGSTFTYTRTDKKADGTIITGTDSTIVAEVIESVHPYENKDSVITVVEGSIDTVRMAYEPNGDVSVYGGLNFGGFPNPFSDSIPKWWKLPTTSKGEIPIASIDIDFSIDFPPITITLKKIVGIADYKTTEDITVGSEKLSSSKVDVTFVLSANISGLPTTFNFIRTYWYCDKIGYFTKVDVHNDDLIAFQLPNYVQVLTSYNLKK